jgi:hypothetical protein
MEATGREQGVCVTSQDFKIQNQHAFMSVIAFFEIILFPNFFKERFQFKI